MQSQIYSVALAMDFRGCTYHWRWMWVYVAELIHLELHFKKKDLVAEETLMCVGGGGRLVEMNHFGHVGQPKEGHSCSISEGTATWEECVRVAQKIFVLSPTAQGALRSKRRQHLQQVDCMK